MKNKVLFGPAGSPINYKGAAYKAPKYISEEGLNSYEYSIGISPRSLFKQKT